MLVGHTHEDIDQMFSRFSTRLNKHNAPTIKTLHSVCKASFSPTPTFDYLDEVIDWCSWFDPHRLSLHGHSVPHQFRITLLKGKPVLHAKEFSDGTYSHAVQLLKSFPDERTEPEVCEHQELELDDLQKTMAHMKRYMTSAEQEEWAEWLSAERKRSRPKFSTTWRAFRAKFLQHEESSSSSSSSSS
jgi:hypothetical protein